MDRADRNRFPWVHYLLIAVLLLGVFVSFWAFARENSERISEQNQRYAEDVAWQAAASIEDRLESREKELDVLTYLVSETIREPNVSSDYLKLLQGTSVFDYVEFIDAEGINHNADGETSNSTDRESYIRGMQGESGRLVIFNSRITHETLVDFYAPVTCSGEIVGVLNGMFREETLDGALSMEVFGKETKSFICMEDGAVIGFSGYDEKPMDNLFAALEEDQVVDAETLAGLKEAFAEHESYRFYGQATYGRGSVSAVPVSDDWMLVQTFPSAVTAQMESDANRTGLRLELRLLTMFLIYAAYLIVSGVKKRRALQSEKVRLGNIVQSLTPLFTRLGIIDHARQSYEYIQGVPPNLSAEGSLADLREYMYPHYFHGNDASSMSPVFDWNEIAASLSGGKPYVQYEYRMDWDSERWENTSVLSLDQKEGGPTSVIFAVQDVTALKKQESAIQQTLRDAFHTAEDLSHAKSDFLARMSHDMRTPMNAVLGMTQIALTHLDDREQIRNCLEKIDTSGRRLLALINEVLDMSKIESGGLVLVEAPFTITDQVDEVYQEAFRLTSEKGQHFHLGIGKIKHNHVLGDGERLKQVLWNLLDNAIKFTPPEGTIRLTVGELTSRTPTSGYYEFIVEDTGSGIEPGLLSRIFEPFVRADSQSGDSGTGLGLPITQTIVKLMDGDISLESEVGQGTTFTVRVFLKLPEGASQLPAEAETSGVWSGKAAEAGGESLLMRHAGTKALLVEDNEINMEIAVELLTMAGVEVESAENGAVAVSMVQERPPGYYDVILMDLQMPVMDGYEAARTIRSLGREDASRIPIIALSANAFQENISKAQDVGMNGHVMKPFNLDKVLAALDECLPPK